MSSAPQRAASGPERTCRGSHQRLSLLLALGAVVCLDLTAAHADPAGNSALLAMAEQAFRAGRYQETLSAAARVPPGDPGAGRARFLQAYAHHKLKQHDQAARLLDSLLERSFTSEAALLGAMVAMARGRWEEAVARLNMVIEAKKPPWEASARKLLVRAREELAVEERRRLSRERLPHGQSTSALEQARASIQSGRLSEASALLDTLGSQPGPPLMLHYYRGLIAYKRGEYSAARPQFDRALSVDPTDGWSRYMMGLTLAKVGERGPAQQVLEQLSSSHTDLELRKLSARALVQMKEESPSQEPWLSLSLETALGLDTNPRYLEESPVDLEAASFAVLVAGRLELRHWFFRRFGGEIGVRLMERAYFVGGEGNEQTEVSPWVSLLLRIWRLSVGASYRYTLALYGHAPLLSRHVGHLAVLLQALPWLDVTGEAWICQHPAHDEAYTYLDGLEVGGIIGGHLSRGILGLGVSYQVLRDWADVVETQVTIHTGEKGTGKGSGSRPSGQTETTTLRTDYSFTGHGPSIWSSFRLPWKLTLRAMVALQWRHFDSVDQLTSLNSGAMVKLDPREDLRLLVTAEVSRALPQDLELAVTYESLDSFSSVSNHEEGLDRNYSRRLVALALRWRFAR